jgi:hypothetical protein
MRYSWFLIVLAALVPQAARAQSAGGAFEIGGHVAIARSGEFDATDTGVGARVAWRAARWVGVEGEITLYPGDYADERAPFSGARIEGLFGATVGPRLGRVRPFARLRPGFLTFREPSDPVACILIFPPPLTCTLPGRTQFALDAGGGVEVSLTPRTLVRLDAGDRAVRYSGPVIDRRGEVTGDAFFRHDLRVTIGAGVVF